MEQQIQDLVSSIRKEGVEEANRERDEILSNTKAEAAKIVSDAKKEAEKMKGDAKNECSLLLESSKAAISQAARDVSLSLKASIEKEIDGILSADVKKAMDTEAMRKIILDAVSAGFSDSDFILPKEKADEVASSLKAELAKEMKAGLKISSGSSDGIKIVANDGSGYVDLSNEEIVNLIKPHLSASLREIIFA